MLIWEYNIHRCSTYGGFWREVKYHLLDAWSEKKITYSFYEKRNDSILSSFNLQTKVCLLKEVGALRWLVQIWHFVIFSSQSCYWASEKVIKSVSHRAKYRKNGGHSYWLFLLYWPFYPGCICWMEIGLHYSKYFLMKKV